MPPPAHEEVDDTRELAEIREIVESGFGWVAERDGAAVGMVLARRRGPRVGRITDLFVTPSARRTGVAEALTRAVVDRFAADGVDVVDLEVMASNAAARAVRALGLPRRGARARGAGGGAGGAARRTGAAPSFGSIHVQTDDVDRIVTAVEMYVPRLPGRSAGSLVSQPRGGYVTVYDDVCDRDPAMLRRLAKDLSSRTGLVVLAVGVEEEAVARMILFDRGGIVDEYASVPEYHGSLPPGEVVALRANPVVVERYTGASQAAIRAVTPVADSPADLPPARELLAGLATALGLAGAEYGWAGRGRGRRRCRQDRPLMLRLVDAPRCPYCARVRIMLAEKGVAHDPVVIDLQDRPPWLYELNASGRVPVLEEDGWALPESAVINEFLEERHPEPPLLPSEHAARAAARLRIFRCDDFTRPYYPLRRGDPGAEVEFAEALGALDATLAATPFLTGGEFGLADIAFVPWVIRARDVLGVSLEAYPHVSAWLAALPASLGRGGDRARRGLCSAWATRPGGARTTARGGRPRPARRAVGGRIPRRGGLPLRRPAGPSPRRAARGRAGARRRREPRRVTGARRRPGGRRSRGVLPLGHPLSDRRAGAPTRRIRRAQLPGLLARVVVERRAPDRAVARLSRRRRRGRPRRAAGRVVPGREALVRLLPHSRSVGQLGLALGEPVVEHVQRHLGMELDAPRALAEPEGLESRLVLREELGAGRELEAVVVPLEGIEPLGQDADDRVGATRVVHVHLAPADLRRPAGPMWAPTERAISCAPRQTPKSGTSRSTASRRNDGLVGEPGMLGVLVGVHRTAEDHDRVVARRGVERRGIVRDHQTRSSRSPRSSTRSSKSPPPPVEPGSWTTDRTRITRA